MRKALALLIALTLVSCSRDEIRVSAIPERLIESDRWGLVTADGEICYDNSFLAVSPVVNGFFNVTDRKGVTVCRRRSTAEPLRNLKNLYGAGYMSEGLIPIATADGRLCVADAFGNVRFELKQLAWKRIIGCSSTYKAGLLWVMTENGLWGAVDRRGKPTIEPVYYCEPVFSQQDVALATRALGNERFSFSFIDNRGAVKYRFPAGLYPTSYVVKGGRVAFVTDDDRRGLISVEGGKIMLPDFVEEIRDFNHTYIIYGDSSGYYGLMGLDGKVMLRPRFKVLDFGCEGQFIASQGDSWYIMDEDGHRMVDFPFATQITYIGQTGDSFMKTDFCYVVKTANRLILTDEKGKRMGDNEYVALDCFPLIEGGLDGQLSLK